MATAIQVHDLHKEYRMGEMPVTALSGVDLAVSPGEFVAIMGPSGSGKSTLLHLLGGLDHPSRGQVDLGGQHLMEMAEHDLTLLRRRKIGVVFQFFNLLPTMTAAENVALPLLLDGLSPAECTARAAEALAWVGLADRAGHTPDRLSGGEQQRVALARAMVSRPDVVLADEPTGNLDSASGEQVLEILRRASREQGQTVIMVTHDPGAAARADRVVFLHDGQVINQLHGPGLSAESIIQTQAHLKG